MNKKFGFFDVDSRHLSENGCSLCFRERVIPLSEKLNRFYKAAEDYDIPLVFTSCCSSNLLKENSLENVLYIPLEKDDAWKKELNDYHLIYLQKATSGIPKNNYNACMFDMFKYNENAYDLFHALNIREWVICGNGFDLCVNAAVCGVLSAGYSVTILNDMLISSAKGYGPYGTEEYKQKLLSDFVRQGVRNITFNDFLDELQLCDTIEKQRNAALCKIKTSIP